jgi:hypothetical protein
MFEGLVVVDLDADESALVERIAELERVMSRDIGDSSASGDR